MAFVRTFLVLAVCLTFDHAAGMKLSANPIRRVVTMLQMMQKKVEEEGNTAQELFDKFMCYCKTGAATLSKSIDEAETKIPQLESDIKGGAAEKTQLASDITQAKADRSAAKSTMAESTAIRDKAATAFAKEAAELKADVAAMGKALAAIKGGSSSFLQTPAATVLRRLAVSADLSLESRDTLTAFLSQGSTSSEDDEYEPESGAILGILGQMKETMEKDIATAKADEAASITDFDALMAAKAKETSALEKEVEQKIARVGESGVELVNNKEDLDDTEKSLVEDKKLLGNLGSSCKTKADEWDATQKTRSEELTAIAETIKLLNDDDALDLFKKTLPQSSFLQVQVQSKEVVRRAKRALRASAGVHDYRLDLISMSMQGKKVDFDKVLGMIDDMVALLKTEQTNDDEKKEYCAKATDKFEDEKKQLERTEDDTKKTIADEKESITALAEELVSLEGGIKALDKSVAEATENRKKENAAYTENLAASNAAVEIIGIAKNRMNKFYNPKLYKAPAKQELSEADQIAVNMGGTAPPTAAPGGIAGTGVTALDQEEEDAPTFVQVSAHRHRKATLVESSQASGVIAMMDTLVADVQKEITEMKFDEKEGQGDYEKFMKDSSEKRSADAKSVAEKEAAKADTASSLQKHGEELKGTIAELMANMKSTMALNTECSWLIENFDVRKGARAGEMDSLTKAKAVLSGADFSL